MDSKKIEPQIKVLNNTITIDQPPDLNEELETCRNILLKHQSTRTEEEVELFAAKIASLQIFGRSLLENLEPKNVIGKLIHHMKYEFFPAGKPIFNFEQPSDKMYIILKGKAKEFIPKTIDEIEKESHNKYGAGSFNNIPGGISLLSSIPETQKVETPLSAASVQWTNKGGVSSLNAISEEDASENGGASDATKKRFRKLKAVLPFLSKINPQKGTVANAEEYRYKKSIKKGRNFLRPIFSEEELNLDALERELGRSVLEEFLKYPKSYFIGGILKVKFSKFLEPGAHCGIRALKDNSLRSRAIFAQEDCYCISLHRDHFANVIENEKILNSDKIEFFKKMFNLFDERTVVEFSLLWENQVCKLNDVIFQQKESANHLYVLCSGEVMFTKSMADAQKSKSSLVVNLPYRLKKKSNNPNEHMVRVATISSGDFFGEEDFFEERPRELTATVISNKAKVYKLSFHKYKTRGKNYSEILKEIRRIMSLKVGWKKERIQDLYEQHKLSLQVNKSAQELRKEQEKNLLNFLSPQSSQRLKQKVMEKTKAIHHLDTTVEQQKKPEYANNISCPDLPEPFSGKLREKFREPDFRYTVHAKGNGNGSKLLDSTVLRSFDKEELGLFSRTRVPREYDKKQESLLKKDNSEIVKLDFKDNSKKRPSTTQKGEFRSQMEDGKKGPSSLSTASIMLIKKRYMKRNPRATAVATTTSIQDTSGGQRAPSLNLDVRLQSQERGRSPVMTINAIQSLNEQTLSKFFKGQGVQSPTNGPVQAYIPSIEQLDRPEKQEKENVSSVDASTRQTLTKTIQEIGSLNKIQEEILAVVNTNNVLSPIHSRPKTRSSTKLLRSTLMRRESWKTNFVDSSLQNSQETLTQSHQKSFKILGERVLNQSGNRSLKTIKLTSGIFSSNNHSLVGTQS